MRNYKDLATVQLQIALNHRMFRLGKITCEMHQKANKALVRKLTNIRDDDIIIISEMIESDEEAARDS